MAFSRLMLDELSLKITDRFAAIVDHFDLELSQNSRSFNGCCPIHSGADNPNAFSFYTDSGVWQCRTHGCHNIFHKTPIGLIRGILSSRSKWKKDGDEIYDFKLCIEYCNKILENAAPKLVKRSVLNKLPKKTYKESALNIDPENYLKTVECPADYYIARGFDADILKKYMIGLYRKKYSIMDERVLVPIFDNDQSSIVGFTGRTIHSKCLMCEGFHSGGLCPDHTTDSLKFQKWINNKGFARSNYLYNYWSAKNHIDKKKIILVEGPSEVWKLEECGIKNSMALFGADITDRQAKLLQSLAPERITTMMDNDEGGQHAEDSCKNRLANILPDCQIINMSPPGNDLGEMTKSEIMEWIYVF